MEELKIKWCVDLEEILQCPVCFERPQKPIYQCKDGHHICCMCRLKLEICPMCQGTYNGSRSYLAEHLSLKLDDIKSSLLQPTPAPRKNKLVAISTQTETAIVTEDNMLLQPAAAKGRFPCKIGECNFYDAYSRMLNHLRYFHKERLCESSNTNGKCYSRKWEIDYISNIRFDLAFFIPKMGMFFLIISINSGGNFVGNVQMVHNNKVAREFKYKLELKAKNRSCSYEGFPRSCNCTADVLYINSLHIPSEGIRQLINKNNRVSCIFTLTRDILKQHQSK